MNFSCLIPVYNTKPHHLLEAFFSIFNQSVKPSDIVIVDDGSSNPDTLAVLSLIKSYPNVSIVRLETNSGTSVALNEGHSLCLSDWIAIMGSDDVAFPDRFLKQLKFIDKNPSADIVGTGLFAFTDSDPFRKPLFYKSHPNFIVDLSNSWITNHGTVFYRKKIVLEHPYNPLVKRGQDVELWKRLFDAGYKFFNIPDTLYAYRRYV